MTPQEHAEELAEAFEMFDEWEDRYAFLIDLSRQLPPFPEHERTDKNLVHGCQSKVWVAPHLRPGTDVVEFDADSDAIITKGLVAMLHRIYNGQPAPAILDFDLEPSLRRMGLDQNLSPARRNGLAGMIARIKTLAAQAT